MSFELVCEWPFRCKPLEVNKQDGRKARQRKSFRRTPKCFAIRAIPVNASQDMSRFYPPYTSTYHASVFSITSS